MKRRLKELWKYSGVLYREMLYRTIMLQQTYASTDPEAVKKVSRSATQMLYIHKILMLMMVIIMILSTVFFISYLPIPTSPEIKTLSIALAFLSYISLNAFLLFFLSIVQTSILLSPDLYQPLLMLNFSDEELSIIALLAYLRIFDAYVFGSLILTVITFTFMVNPLTAMLLAISLGATHLITLWVITAISKSYLRFSAPELSKVRLLIKILVIIGYTLVFALLYVIPFMINNVLPIIIKEFSSLPQIYRTILLYLPPLSIAYLAAIVYVGTINAQSLVYLSLSFAIYLIISWRCYKGILKIILAVPYTSWPTPQSKTVIPKEFRVGKYFQGLLIKDFKLLIRQVNYAILLFLGPVLFAVYAIIYHVMEMPPTMLVSMMYPIVLVLSMSAVNILGIEGRAAEFLLSLPVSLKDIAKSKAVLITFSYIIFGLSATGYFAIFLKDQIVYGIVILINTLGMFVGSYKIIRKAIRYIIETGVLLTDLSKNISFLLYVTGIAILFGILPLVITSIIMILARPIQEILLTAIALQLGYFITYKLSK